VNDFLTEKHKEITDRLKELKPLVEEHARLEAAASALAGVGAAAAAAVTAPRRRGPGRPRGSVGRKKAKATKVTTAKAPAAAKVVTSKPAKKPAKAKAARKKAGGGRPGRRKGSGTRAAEALAFVQGQPGITIPELAAKMGIKQNYLYRVLPGLEQEKKVAKRGRGWFPGS
jgi:hypothetical protein